MSRDEPLARLARFLRTEIVVSAVASTQGVRLAVGWATVELDRAVTELAAASGIPVGRFAEAPECVILGARCLVAAGALPGGVSLVVLEPATEGRLAATLAKHDEGPAAVWLAVEGLADAVARPGAVEDGASLAQDGPFGPERLVNGPMFGPHRLLVERPGTIRA